MNSKFSLTGALLLLMLWLSAQDNYEIQVYDAETTPMYSTMFELHSNLTVIGNRQRVDGVVPSHLAWHETVEITQGITPWFEIGTYLFTSGNQGDYRLHWVGDHIRPRIRVPDQWHWPLGLSLSVEAGYQRREYSTDTWTIEFRPIMDKEWKNFTVCFNPAIEYAFVGESHANGPGFSPAAKLSYKFWKYLEAGVEYYGSIGAFKHISPLKEQQHQIGPVIDVNISPVWEINIGYIFGLTPATDRGIVKLILGRRADWNKCKRKAPSVPPRRRNQSD